MTFVKSGFLNSLKLSKMVVLLVMVWSGVHTFFLCFKVHIEMVNDDHLSSLVFPSWINLKIESLFCGH